jgi:hypothetical protein
MAPPHDEPDDIDRLYQTPLPEFVKARTALARQAGPRAAEIKVLQKPHVAAWAVNQLYWRRRKTYDRLVSAAERARKSLTQSLGGGGGSASAEADAAHAQAVSQAAAEVRDILAKAGASTAPDTIRLVRETLLALPSPDRPGRLVRPLAPLGFESLTSALQRSAHSTRPPATVLPWKAAPKKTAAASADKTAFAAKAREQERHNARAALERKRELATIDKELSKAQTAARQAESELAGARRAHAKAERRLQELQASVDAGAADVQRALAEIRRLERVSKDAATARDHWAYRRASAAPKD